MVFRRGELVYRDGEFTSDCRKSIVVARMVDPDRAEHWGSMDSHRALWIERYGYSPTRTAIRREELLGENQTVEENEPFLP
jgi:hypothetical protein